MDGMSNGSPTPCLNGNGSLPLPDAINKRIISPEIKSWRFIQEQAPLVELINSGAVTDKTDLVISPDKKVTVSGLSTLFRARSY